MLRAIIFDLDGTLLDTETSSDKAINKILNEYSCVEISKELKLKLLGRPAHEWTVTLKESNGLKDKLITPQEIATKWNLYLKEYYPSTLAMPGASAFLDHMREKYPHVVLAIATSSNKAAMECKLSFHESMFKGFNVIVCGDEVALGKPAPDIYLQARDQIQQRYPELRDLTSNECLVFEDSVAGMQSGLSAGMQVVGISSMIDVEREHYNVFQQLVGYLVDFTQIDTLFQTIKFKPQ